MKKKRKKFNERRKKQKKLKEEKPVNLLSKGDEIFSIHRLSKRGISRNIKKKFKVRQKQTYANWIVSQNISFVSFLMACHLSWVS